MQKFSRFLIIIVLLAVAGYTGLWFYRASLAKELILSQIDDLNAKDEVIFEYSDLSIKGFPVGFTVVIDKPVLIAKEAQNGAEKKAVIISSPQWLIQSNFIGDSYTVTTDEIAVVPEEDAQKKDTQVTVSIKDAVINMGFLRNGWRDILDGQITFEEPVWYTYHDNGGVVARYKDNEVMMHVKPSSISYAKKDMGEREQVDMDLAVAMQVTEALKALANENGNKNTLDGFSWKCGMSVEQPKGSTAMIDNRKINVKFCELMVDDLSVAVNGVIETSKDDLFPSGKLDIVIDEYEKLLASLQNQGVISVAQKKAVEEILPEVINTEESQSSHAEKYEGVVLAVSREKDAEFYIGSLSLSQLLQRYQMVQAAQMSALENPEENAAENEIEAVNDTMDKPDNAEDSSDKQ